MKKKDFISNPSPLAGKLVLPLLLLLFTVFFTCSQVSVASQSNRTESIELQDFQSLSEPIYNALLIALQQETASGRLEPSVFGLLSWKQHEESWGIGTVGIYDNLSNSYSLENSFLIIAKQENGYWQSITGYNPQFESWLYESPETFMAREAIPLLSRFPSPQATYQTEGIPLDLRFPWRDGQAWMLGAKGVHDLNALDFLPHRSIAVQDREVVAAYGGVVFRRCSNHTTLQEYLVIRHPDVNGQYATEYFHLDRTTVSLNVGDLVIQGNTIGKILNFIEPPPPESPCANTNSDPHVHFGVATISPSGVFSRISIVGTVINGWTVNSNSCLTKGNLTECRGKYFSNSTGAVNGQVYDFSNQPVSGATIKFFGNDLIRRETSTDFNGLYESPDVPAGVTTITAVKDGVAGSVTMNVATHDSQQAPDITLNSCTLPLGSATAVTDYFWRTPATECGPAEQDNAVFIVDVTIPDGTRVTPNQSLEKTWQLRNTGSTSWGNGYQLAFVSGNPLSGPNAVNVPATAPNNTANISVNLIAPSTEGVQVGYWRLRNPQGTYFGPLLSVEIEVREPSTYPITLTADPASPADTDSVHFYARVDNFPNFRAMRLKIDGNVVYEVGAPTFDYDWSTSNTTSGSHNIVVEVANQTDTSWAYPEVRSLSYTLEGNSNPDNHVPNAPTPTSPDDWHVYYSGSAAQLCAQENGDPDGDAITEYYFEIYDSAQLWNSGWTTNNCPTTSSLGPYGYQWHVKVHDIYGAESEWSTSRHFTLVNPSLSITELYFEPLDGDSEQVRIRACTAGQGGVGITLRVSVNDANDGSSNGTWRVLKELGVPCFNQSDAPMWYTLDDGDGSHRIRAEAHGSDASWDGAAVREEVYTLPHRRPQNPPQIAPVSASANPNEPIYLNSRTILFQWGPALRATNYTLHISTTPAPGNDPTPLFRQTFDSTVTQYTVTLDQDYPAIYWQVEASNDKGSSSSTVQIFGIDQLPSACAIGFLPSVVYENVFQVSWTASDNTSGTRFTDIQYLDGDREEWQDWLTLLPTSQAFDLFNGQSGHAYRFRCRSVDYAGNMEDYSAPSSAVQVDPTARPQEPWWNSAYSQKRSVTVLNNDVEEPLPIDYPLHIRFDTTTTPSAATIFNGSESLIKCDDLRVIYNNTTELTRYIPVCTADLIEIWFRNQQSIPTTTANNTAYRLYYGYASASNPPANQTDVWYPLVDANTVGLWFFSEGTGSSLMDHSGYGNNGNTGALAWADGLFGKTLKSLAHDSGNGAFIPGTASMGSGAFTLEFFAKRDDSGEGYIAGMGASGNDNERMRLQIQGPGTIKFQVDPSPGGASDIWAYSICLPNLEWQHIAVTFDGYNAGAIYCGGVLAGSGTSHDPGINTHNFDLYLGSDFSIASRFKGSIDQVRLSNIVRTSFPYAGLAYVTLPPTLVAGDLIPAPTTEQPDLAIQTVKTYVGSNGGTLVEVVIQNLGIESTQNGFYTDLYIDHVPTGAGDYTGSLQFWVNEPIEAGAIVTLTTMLEQLPAQDVRQLNTPDQNGEVRGVLYAQVDSTGVVHDLDTQNNIYSSGTDFCLASVDSYESDDSWQDAGPITLNGSQTHNFYRPGDEDWFVIQAEAGKMYFIRTLNLKPSADTYLYLYDSDGVTVLMENDDYYDSLASYLEWTAPTSGQYYLRVKHWNPNVGGCGTNYTLTFKNTPFDFIYLPIVFR